MKNKILVTGAAGFIGTNLVLELNSQGIDDIVCVDFLDNSEKWKNLSVQKFTEYYEADKFTNVIKDFNFDCIFHLGACSNTREKDSRYLIENNYRYSIELVQHAFRNKIRFIYASSAATYGAGEKGYLDDESKIDGLRPLNAYGYSKQIFDQWLYRKNLLQTVVGLKYFNIYGPYEDHKGDMRSIVKKAYEQIKANGVVNLFKSYRDDYEDGEQKRDFLYVKEAVKMTDFFRVNSEFAGLYNIGMGKENSWNSLVKLIFEALQLSPRINYIDMPEDLIEQYQYFTKAEIDKIKKAGYKLKYDFKESVFDYVRNYLEKR